MVNTLHIWYEIHAVKEVKVKSAVDFYDEIEVPITEKIDFNYLNDKFKKVGVENYFLSEREAETFLMNLDLEEYSWITSYELVIIKKIQIK